MDFDIAIIGTGPVGLIAALALSHMNRQQGGPVKALRIALLGPRPTREMLAKDTRTTAFMQPSLALLQNLEILEPAQKNAAPLLALKMIDDTGRLLRAPDCHFEASELELPYFALNIPNQDLNAALIQAIANCPDITWHETKAVTTITHDQGGLTFSLAEGQNLSASFCIGADGRNALSRKTAAIPTKEWDYNQTAIACAFTHSLAHNSTSIEIHRKTGPLTLIPLKEYHASLVWSLTPEQAAELTTVTDHEFKERLRAASLGFYGDINSIGKRVAFPIKGMKLETLGQNRIALIGEAAHIVPPIGAQGLNMGVMDVAHLTDAIFSHGSPASKHQQIIEDYMAKRLPDVHRRTQSIDILNKSLIGGQFSLHLARTIGLNFLKKAAPLRRFLMNQGLGAPLELVAKGDDASPLPSLMQTRSHEEAYS